MVVAHLKLASLSGSRLTDSTLSGADLKWTDLTGVIDLNVEQLKRAENWDHAFFSRDLIDGLGLPSDHNQRIAKEVEAVYPKYYQWGIPGSDLSER